MNYLPYIDFGRWTFPDWAPLVVVAVKPCVCNLAKIWAPPLQDARTGSTPFAVHNTYQYSGGVGKVRAEEVQVELCLCSVPVCVCVCVLLC